MEERWKRDGMRVETRVKIFWLPTHTLLLWRWNIGEPIDWWLQAQKFPRKWPEFPIICCWWYTVLYCAFVNVPVGKGSSTNWVKKTGINYLPVNGWLNFLLLGVQLANHFNPIGNPSPPGVMNLIFVSHILMLQRILASVAASWSQHCRPFISKFQCLLLAIQAFHRLAVGTYKLWIKFYLLITHSFSPSLN